MRQVAGLAVALLLAACGAPDKSPGEPDTGSAFPTATTTTTTAAIVDFGDEGAVVQEASDASNLAGTSAEFQDFIVGLAEKLSVPSGDEECVASVRVTVYDPSGFASGSVNECGGYATIWALKDGSWQEVWGGQDLADCADLRAKEIPPSVVMEQSCFDHTDKDNPRKVAYTG